MPDRSLREGLLTNVQYFIKWTLFAMFCGFVIGMVGTLFRRAIDLVTWNWNERPWMILFAPIAITLINLLIKFLHEEGDTGTNLVIDSIVEGKHITGRTTPLYFFATILSHSVGASVGKEGAALMVGGSLGEFFSNRFHFDERDKRIAIMCGMSACFSAIFGTPLAAALFPIEMISIGIMYYAALVPCMFAAFYASKISFDLGNRPDLLPVRAAPSFDFMDAFSMLVFGIYIACIAILFAVLLNRCNVFAKKHMPNPWARGIVSAVILVLLTFLNYNFLWKGGFQFNGGGMALAEMAMKGRAPWYAFFLKLIFTLVCVTGGFKGGEIVPTFCLGACAGALFAEIFNLNMPIFTACGMAAMFAGMTNCPISALLFAFELFGYTGMPYYAVSIAVTFTFSGYYGLYTSQRFAYSKTANQYIGVKGPRRFWKTQDKQK